MKGIIARHLTFAAVAILSVSAWADDAGQVTFTRDVAPIFQKACQECHRPGDIGPMSLLDYDSTRPWAKSIKKSVTEKTMPPFFAEKGEYEFTNDPSLTDEEIATIVRWVDQGAQMGDPKDMPEPIEFDTEGWKSGKPDMVFEVPTYTLAAGINDEYRCYVFKTNLPEDTWVQGIEYKPGNRKVVHHIMAYAEPTQATRSMDDETPEPGFLCGMSGAGGGQQRLDMLLGGWAPGTPPNIFDAGVGRVLPANTDIVYQVHYHNETGEDQDDTSAMAIYFAREPIQKVSRISLVGQFRLDIPAGDANAVHEGYWRAPYDINLFSLMPHMHYIGKAMKVTATFPDGRQSVLLNVPNFDFNWQIVYGYKDTLFIPKGTKFHMISVHDNSAENPANPFDPPRPMAWGEATDEEMAHCWIGFTKADEQLGINPTPPQIVGQAEDDQNIFLFAGTGGE